jgi:HK97 family phage portal protein
MPIWPWTKRDAPAVEERATEWGTSAIPLPGAGMPGPGFYAHTGRYVSAENAMGLPAVGAAIRLISETIASLPLVCYRGEGADRARAYDSPNYRLLHDRPNSEQSAFEFWGDVASSIETTGNAFIQKLRARGRVEELLVLDPNFVRVYRDRETGEKKFDVLVDQKRYEGFSTSEILHIRGYTLRGGLVGISPIAEHRHALGVALAAEEFAGRAYANDATPGLAIKVPGNLGRQQAMEMLSVWQTTHAGIHNARKPAVLTNGADIATLSMSLADAELIEAMRFSVEQVARIFRIPPAMLGAPNAATNQTAEEESLRFVRYCLLPRLRRIEMALRADDDLFPTGDLTPEWLVDGLLRADTATRYAAYVQARQAGWLSANEIRAFENLPPISGGDEVQQTPVGGAPNLQPGGGGPSPAPAEDPGTAEPDNGENADG